MARAIYPLQAVFDIREREKKNAEEFYAKEKQRAAAEQEILVKMKDELSNMQQFREQKKSEYFEMMRSQISIQKIQANDAHVKSLKFKEEQFLEKIAAQEQVVKKAEDDVQVALDALTLATQEFKALEKHHEKWLKELKKQIEKKEEEIAEDISQSQFLKKQRGD